MVNTRSTVRDRQGVNDGEETITPSSDETVERNEPNDEFVQASGISLPLMQFQQYWEKERAALVEQLQVEWSASLGDLREAMQEDWRSFLAEFQSHVAWRCPYPPVTAVVQMQNPGTPSQPSTSQAAGWFPKQDTHTDQVSSLGNARKSE
ncbi:hypothetical protein GE061_006641 [Apolygus lucorum]|uniref:Uncharacterized protein n=1 Tax=Apolygus lucorum TaxID=248454 RepID=A0A8S9WW58_APOLU|nr:hypothetical protein GE061_006641 [Apolygus lucorum]